MPARATTSADVAVDTWQVAPPRRGAWQVRVTLLRRAGRDRPRRVDRRRGRLPAARRRRRRHLGARRPGRGIDARRPALLADDPPRPVPRSTAAAARPGAPRRRLRWCSATTTRCRRRRRTPGCRDGHADPWVDHAARATYDHGYDGTGNWPFNTAYAATRTGNAFVTRLREPARGRAVHRGRHPAGRLDRLRRGELDRRPDPLDRRPPRGDRRLHRRRRRRRQRPGRPEQRSACAASTTAASSRTPGCRKSGGTVYVIRDADPPAAAGGNATGDAALRTFPHASRTRMPLRPRSRRRRPASGR